jgi:hypothetical protein
MTDCTGVFVYEWLILFFNKYSVHTNIFILRLVTFCGFPLGGEKKSSKCRYNIELGPNISLCHTTYTS